MRSFLEFFNNSNVIGTIVPVEVENIGTLNAKADTGNDGLNVIHGINIQQDGENITFTTVDNKTITVPATKENIDINIGSGNIENRPVINLNISIGGRKTVASFSLADRSQNEEPILLSKGFLATHGVVVDPSKS